MSSPSKQSHGHKLLKENSTNNQENTKRQRSASPPEHVPLLLRVPRKVSRPHTEATETPVTNGPPPGVLTRTRAPLVTLSGSATFFDSPSSSESSSPSPPPSPTPAKPRKIAKFHHTGELDLKACRHPPPPPHPDAEKHKVNFAAYINLIELDPEARRNPPPARCVLIANGFVPTSSDSGPRREGFPAQIPISPPRFTTPKYQTFPSITSMRSSLSLGLHRRSDPPEPKTVVVDPMKNPSQGLGRGSPLRYQAMMANAEIAAEMSGGRVVMKKDGDRNVVLHKKPSVPEDATF
ncbi:hypothetical protein CVT24_002550 [Panaeolus cyanescens]|uniref:Uncharacterized protein n=1 Tax=Panaeolus cyanescens TaxID=181874 RepID=A0A409YY65_9AGAR|nr:hypothetical protein CVT24_002550 [Panaeolus cyanescens]